MAAEDTEHLQYFKLIIKLRQIQTLVKNQCSSLSLFTHPSNHSGEGAGQIPHQPNATSNDNRWKQQQQNNHL